MAAWTYSGSATTRDERLTILDGVRQASGDEAAVVAVAEAMAMHNDEAIDITVRGYTMDAHGSADLDIEIATRLLWTAPSADAVRLADAVILWFGHLGIIETFHVAESLVVVRA